MSKSTAKTKASPTPTPAPASLEAILQNVPTAILLLEKHLYDAKRAFFNGGDALPSIRALRDRADRVLRGR